MMHLGTSIVPSMEKFLLIKTLIFTHKGLA